MTKFDAAKAWSLNYRLLMTVIAAVGADVAALGVDPKELFVLAEIDDHPNPAAIAARLSMPKPTVTALLKRLEAAGFVRRAIDPADLRRHRLTLTPSGRKTTTRGLAILSDAFGERLSRLSATERTQFEALLEKLA